MTDKPQDKSNPAIAYVRRRARLMEGHDDHSLLAETMRQFDAPVPPHVSPLCPHPLYRTLLSESIAALALAMGVHDGEDC
ncbi:hypothetical protein FAM23867_000780 [Propionibacterium freudenreichii]|uniref:hypothetical protein n=1 Tax=Propionibacterium freudenreichii TaxID=1744 RepID=UPI000BC2D494|nr:hypothetical protein [Propionibacterium freudenreichii]MDK9347121.1 hypothetical protein [Propionibacterium freudenreichii]SBM42790.1 Hypothetical protein PFR_JS2_631 [Propionibacterium freudenreichii]